ncbi:MAG: ribbon-helix-helix protein, CopG family [Candidatus Competibacter sp.]|nr:ribbon-helix-helix protein, CopG family [Candidatus Competibacter sp.]
MRIQTQLDDQRLKKLRYLVETTHASTSEVIRQAIDYYYSRINKDHPSAADVLIQSGFVGCGEASPEFSTNYKSELDQILAQKYGDR